MVMVMVITILMDMMIVMILMVMVVDDDDNNYIPFVGKKIYSITVASIKKGHYHHYR